jgi:hypothetical protein
MFLLKKRFRESESAKFVEVTENPALNTAPAPATGGGSAFAVAGEPGIRRFDFSQKEPSPS